MSQNDPPRRMSFHNRVLLDRAAVTGLERIEVMLLGAPSKSGGDEPYARVSDALARRARRLGGRVRRATGAVGYLRVEIPIEKLLDLVAVDTVAAWQIATRSRASWYRDSAPKANALMFRNSEVSPPGPPPEPPAPPALPVLTPAEAQEPGYTADDDVWLGVWRAEHPTFDGRGVTIAFVETGQPSFTDQTLHRALTLDGQPIPKLAGILNSIDPEHPDASRVRLDTVLHARSAWARAGARTLILPGPGDYSFGVFRIPAGNNLGHEFGVLRDERSGEIRLDTNGNADFQDEMPVPDVNERFEPRALTLRHPQAAELPFVMARGRTPDAVHVYVGAGSHQAMTVSVAAGDHTDEGLAHGVAPGARVLLVRAMSGGIGLSDLIEGYLEAARHPAVDVVNTSAVIDLVPDTAADFAGALFERIATVYGKLLIAPAGNSQLYLGSASGTGGLLTVGGSLGPRTFSALYGGALDGLLVHPAGAAGPSLDGAIAPDVLAPMERIAADLPWRRDPAALPSAAPEAVLPAGYQISCCSSASSPYAAGVAALLVSAAKQRGIPYSVETLGRAMRIGAQYLPGHRSHEQGHGVLDVRASWRELCDPLDIPHITASARVAHPLARYAAGESAGRGIFEFEGWTAGMTGTRSIAFRRESGPAHPMTYRLSWTGNDGTFASAGSVTLPRGESVAVPVTIAGGAEGARSALLNLHDPATDRVVFRTQATIVFAAGFDRETRIARLSGTVAPMRARTHFVHVPPGAGAIGIELRVARGAVRAAIVPGHGLYPNYYTHLHPGTRRIFGVGQYVVHLPNPAPGTWAVYVSNDAIRRGPGADAAIRTDASYSLTFRRLHASLQAGHTEAGGARVDIANEGTHLVEPVVEASPAQVRTHRHTFLPTGLPGVIDVRVPEGTTALALRLRTDSPQDPAELHLYDCTSGECFSYALTIPASPDGQIVVRHPRPGRWTAAVSPAPASARAGEFVLEETLAFGTALVVQTRAPSDGAPWIEHVDVWDAKAVFVELVDLAAERREREAPWNAGPFAMPLDPRRAAAGWTVLRRE